MPGLDIAHGPFVRLNALQKVGPQLFDVLRVWLVELGVLVNDGLLRVGGVERPAIEPAHVKCSFRAVKITADGLLRVSLLRVIGRVQTMLPRGRERFKLEGGYLRIRGVGVVAFDVSPAG